MEAAEQRPVKPVSLQQQIWKVKVLPDDIFMDFIFIHNKIFNLLKWLTFSIWSWVSIYKYKYKIEYCICRSWDDAHVCPETSTLYINIIHTHNKWASLSFLLQSYYCNVIADKRPILSPLGSWQEENLDESCCLATGIKR